MSNMQVRKAARLLVIFICLCNLQYLSWIHLFYFGQTFFGPEFVQISEDPDKSIVSITSVSNKSTVRTKQSPHFECIRHCSAEHDIDAFIICAIG